MLLIPDLVESRQLEIIQANGPGDVTKCCNEMFAKWLESDTSASWKQLITALQSPGIQLNTVADHIQKMLLKGEAIIINRL